MLGLSPLEMRTASSVPSKGTRDSLPFGLTGVEFILREMSPRENSSGDSILVGQSALKSTDSRKRNALLRN